MQCKRNEKQMFNLIFTIMETLNNRIENAKEKAIEVLHDLMDKGEELSDYLYIGEGLDWDCDINVYVGDAERHGRGQYSCEICGEITALRIYASSDDDTILYEETDVYSDTTASDWQDDLEVYGYTN